MTTKQGFNDFYQANAARFSLGEAFCRYFNVDDAELRAEKDEAAAQQLVNDYFARWGVD